MFSKSAAVLAAATLAEFAFFVVLASRFNPFLVMLVALACTLGGVRLLVSRLPLLVAPGRLADSRRPSHDVVLEVVGAGLLILPGLLTAALGGLLFMAPVRWLLTPIVESRIERWIPMLTFAARSAHRGDVVDVTATAKDSSRGS